MIRLNNSPRLTLLMACGLALMAAYFFRPGSDATGLAAALSILGMLALWLALRGTDAGFPAKPPLASAFSQPHRIHRALLAVGCIALLALAEVNGAIVQQIVLGDSFRPDDALRLPSAVQMLLLIGGIVAVMVALVGWHPRELRGLAAALHENQREAAAVMLITGLALLLRLIDLEHSVHTFIDEIHLVESINALNRDPYTYILRPFDQIATFTWVYPYFEMLATHLLGPTFTGLRLTSAIVGTLTIPALYGLARMLFGWRVALVAALLLATFPPFLHFSRLAMILMASPLIGLVALACLVRALWTGTQRWYALAGAVLGLHAYFDEAGELLFPLLIALWLLWLWLRWRRSASRAGLRWLVTGFMLTSFPAYVTLLGIGAGWLSRLSQNNPQTGALVDTLFAADAVGSLRDLLAERILPPFLHYIHLPDTSEIYYAGETALVLPWLVPLLLLGVWHCIRRPGGAGMLLLIWVTGTALGNSLLQYSTWSARYMVVAPALCLLIATGLTYTLNALITQAYLWRAAVLACALLIGVGQVFYYFGEHLPLYRATVPPWQNYDDVAFRAADLPASTRVFLIYGDAVFVPHYATLFEFWGVEVDFTAQEMRHLSLRQLARLPADADYAFFVDPRDRRTPLMLAQFWDLPLPQLGPYPIDPRKQYLLYFAPADARHMP